MGKRQMNWIAARVSLTLLASGAANAQMTVFDPAAFGQLIQQITQMKAQFDQMKALNEGFNKITNMGDVASLLNNPAIRSALPKTFSSVESSLRGGGGGGFGDQFASGNQSYVSPGNDFYATELGRQQSENAGQMGLASQMYDAATKRMEGMEQLRQELSQSADAKTTMDLQARLTLEQTFLQIDINRMQALQMLQQAQWQVAQTREREELQKDADAYRRQFPEVSAAGR